MNQIRITIVVPEMDDDKALKLKKDLEALLKEEAGATVTMTLRPAASPLWH